MHIVVSHGEVDVGGQGRNQAGAPRGQQGCRCPRQTSRLDAAGPRRQPAALGLCTPFKDTPIRPRFRLRFALTFPLSMYFCFNKFCSLLLALCCVLEFFLMDGHWNSGSGFLFGLPQHQALHHQYHRAQSL